MQWSPVQEEALAAVRSWLGDPNSSDVFRLFGFAGTGKTTLAKFFAEDVDGRVLFGAYTGKAALVLRERGCHNARTLHNLIYRPRDKSQEKLREFQKELDVEIDDDRKLQLQSLIRQENENLKRPSFTLNYESDVLSAAVLVIDEVSMVDKDMGSDLVSFGTPILVLGDPEQLPPVMGGGYFTEEKPDVMLTEIHRQAQGSPIIKMATRVRLGAGLDYGEWGNSKVVHKGHLTMEQVAQDFDQILVGKNDTRKEMNRLIRDHLGLTHGPEGHLPTVGDKLVCLRNNADSGLLNGSLWEVVGCNVTGDDEVAMQIKDWGEDSKLTRNVTAHRHYFEDREEDLRYWEVRDRDCFDYGYALTVHKAQGSQWHRVMIIDESHVFRQHKKRWLYTAITRAEDQVVVVR